LYPPPLPSAYFPKLLVLRFLRALSCLEDPSLPLNANKKMKNVIKEWPLIPFSALIVFRKVSCVNFYLKNGLITLYVFLSEKDCVFMLKKKFKKKKKNPYRPPVRFFGPLPEPKNFFFLGLMFKK
jgi:hypothetical protein